MRCVSTGARSGVASGGRASRLLAAGKNLYLAGFMGTGKSAAARSLARALGAPWVDLDAEVERAAGMSVSEIFASRGERGFRAAEHRVLARVAAEGGRVVALGGGTVCFDRNRAALRGTGPVVLLTAAPDVIWKRVGAGASRPLLAGPGGRETMERLLERRRAHYRRYRLRIDTAGLPPAGVADAVIRSLDDAARSAEKRRARAGALRRGATCR